MKPDQTLPTFAAYKTQCQDSSGRWLAFQSTLNDVRLVEFKSKGVIKQIFAINIGSQPLKALRIVTEKQSEEPYLALAFHSKYIIMKKNEEILKKNIQLKCNIADFDNGYVSCEGVNDSLQIYFIFVTKKGHITTVPVEKPENTVEMRTDAGKKISSLCTRNSIAFLGTQDGSIIKFDLNSKKIVGSYDTHSQLPIFSIKMAQEYLIMGTCHGQIHVIDQQLKQVRIISGHQAMVAMIAVKGNKVYSVGDDFVLRVWEVEKNGVLDERKSEVYNQKPNLIFTVFNSTYLNFYQETTFFEI